MKKTVDLLIPYHKIDNFLEQCLTSVGSQVNASIRTILINDTPNQIRPTQSLKKRVGKIVDSGGYGYNHAIAVGLECVENEFVAFLDSDDTMDPQRISTQLQNLEERSSDLNYCNLNRIDHKGNQSKSRLGVVNSSNSLLPLLLGSYGANSSWLFKSILISDPDFMTGPYQSIDWATALRIFGRIKTSHTNLPLYNYRRHSNQMTKQADYFQDAFSEVYQLWFSLSNSYKLPPLMEDEARAISFPTIGSPWSINLSLWVKQFLEVVSEQDPDNLDQYKVCIGARQLLSNFSIKSMLRPRGKNYIQDYFLHEWRKR